MSFTPGQFIYHNKYEILALIGEGSFARVWKAREPGFADRLVAIKELKREELTPEEVRKAELRFGLETQIARAMREHNVPSVVFTNTVEVLPESGEQLLVMDFMPGGSLEERIDSQPAGMPILEALDITLSICAALAAFHHLPGIQPVHRDIKPSNILFDAGGAARLADFGVAQVQGRTITGSRTRGTAEFHPGSVEYMAPEQESEVGYLRPAADIFALGCVLFEMLTGKLYKRQRTGTPPSAFRPGLPQQLDALLANTLAENPDDRFQSAEALAGALQSVRDEVVAEQKRREQISDLHRRAEDALTGKEFVAARQAVAAWLALSPNDSQAGDLHARIDAGEQEAALASEIAGYRAAFETALKNENWSAARAALANWERVAPGDPASRADGKRLTRDKAGKESRTSTLVILAISFTVGFSIGLIVFGLWLTPLPPPPGFGPQDLLSDFQAIYIQSAADLFSHDLDQDRVREDFADWPEAASAVCQMAQEAPDPNTADRLTTVALILNGQGCRE